MQNVNPGTFLKTHIKIQSKETANTHILGNDASMIFERISEPVQM